MKDNSNKDISVGFIIEPVHQNNKRENAHNEVQTIKPSLTHYVSMIITFDTCKGEMPYSPIGSKQHRYIEKAHTRAETIGTITMPCKFFKCRSKDKKEPYRKDTRSESIMTCNNKL